MNKVDKNCECDGTLIPLTNFIELVEDAQILHEVENTEICKYCNSFHNTGIDGRKKIECNKKYRDLEKGKRDKGKNKKWRL